MKGLVLVTNNNKTALQKKDLKWQTLSLVTSIDDVRKDFHGVTEACLKVRVKMVASTLSESRLMQDFARQIIFSVLGSGVVHLFLEIKPSRNSYCYQCTDKEQAEIKRLFSIGKAELIERSLEAFLDTICYNKLFTGAHVLK